MVQISVTMDPESYRRLMTQKPRYMKKAEWARHLMMQQLERVAKALCEFVTRNLFRGGSE